MDANLWLLSLATFSVTLVTTLVLTPVARRAALWLNVVDRPDGQRKLQRRPVPLLGGVAVAAGLAVGLITLGAMSPLSSENPLSEPRGLACGLLSLCLLCVVGVCDDAWNLRARWKFLAQIVATLPAAWAASGMERASLFGFDVSIGWWNLPLTLLWLVIGINALNLIDGMDGMASTAALAIALSAALVDVCSGQGHSLPMATCLAGALVAFLVFNFPPASIYLGDAGSMVIGLMVSLLSLSVAQQGAEVNLTTLLLLLGVPLADTSLAILRRTLSGRGIWHPDREHIHHRLLDRGLAPRQVLALVAALSLIAGGVVAATRFPERDSVAWACALGAAILSARWQLIGHHEWSLLRSLARSVFSGQPAQPVGTARLAGLSFSSAWNQLLSAVAPYGPESVELVVHQPNGSVRRHEWNAAQLSATEDAMALELKWQARDSGICELRVRASRPSATTDGRHWSRFVDTLESFGRFWADHPETLPAAVLRPDEQSIVMATVEIPVRHSAGRAA